MAVQTLKNFLKSSEGQAAIETGKVFLCDGYLFQGYCGGPMPVEEGQLSMDELKAVEDRDGTMHKVWFRVQQRQGSRHDRKSKEYSIRRKGVREEKQALRDSMVFDKKELGLDPSEADKQELKKLDKRMLRLADPELEENFLYAEKHSKPHQPEAAPVEPEPLPVQGKCPECNKMCPPGKVFDRWLRGHTMGAHRQKNNPATQKAASA